MTKVVHPHHAHACPSHRRPDQLRAVVRIDRCADRGREHDPGARPLLGQGQPLRLLALQVIPKHLYDQAGQRDRPLRPDRLGLHQGNAAHRQHEDGRREGRARPRGHPLNLPRRHLPPPPRGCRAGRRADATPRSGAGEGKGLSGTIHRRWSRCECAWDSVGRVRARTSRPGRMRPFSHAHKGIRAHSQALPRKVVDRRHTLDRSNSRAADLVRTFTCTGGTASRRAV